MSIFKKAIATYFKKYHLTKYKYQLNKYLFGLALKGLGINNFENTGVSGEKWFIDNYLKDDAGFIVFDIGAFQGDYLQDIRSRFKLPRVYCFEPHPKNYLVTKEKAVKLGGTTVVENLGMGDVEGEFTIYDYAQNDASQHASLVEGVITELHKAQAAGHTVKVDTIDSYCQRNGINHIDLLKIDTEGFEYKILTGASGLLAAGAIKTIQFEFNEMNVLSRAFFRDFKMLLQGYHLYRLMPDGLINIDDEPPIFTELFAFQNIVALKK